MPGPGLVAEVVDFVWDIFHFVDDKCIVVDNLAIEQKSLS